jgi:hypothetical protein
MVEVRTEVATRGLFFTIRSSMEKIKIFIKVEGGVVQDVSASSPDIEVILFDVDNIKASEQELSREQREELEIEWSKGCEHSLAITGPDCQWL